MSLKAQAVSGVKWSGASMGVIVTLQFVTLAILARLLSPSDFGLMGMVMVVIGFAQAFSDMGLSNAIIYRQDVEENHLSSFFWVNVLTGVIIFVCILLARGLVTIYFKEPSLSNYLIFAAFIFLITPVGQIFNTLLRKELKFKTLSKIEIGGMVAYSLSAIGLAMANFGVLSLIMGQLVRSLLTVCILFFVFRGKWMPRFYLNIKEIRSYFSFGAFQMGEKAVNYLRSNIDYIIIGRFLGPAALGFYTLAYQLITFPMSKINPTITRVAFPAFSKIQDDDSRMRRGYCKVINYISMISFPMLAGMLVVAPEFIGLVYGLKWEPSVIVVQILCLAGMFWSIGDPVGSVLLAKGRVDIGFYWNVFSMIVTTIAIIIGVNWGIVGVAGAILLLRVPFFFVVPFILNRLIDLKFSKYIKALQLPFVCSIFMVAGIILLKQILYNINTLPIFITSIVGGAIIYITSYYVQDRTAFSELRSMLKGG
ncbi:MAG: MOP flippase family protein [Candidatus Tritonobacter lacicola]|nr:MOP flippase family protein [Candidatus Tritonobacter lacicola]